MRALLAAICLVCLASLASAQTLSQREFTTEIANALRAAAPKKTVEMTSDKSLRIRHEDGSFGMIDTSDTYALYRSDPARRTEFVQGHVALLTKSNLPHKGDQSRIIPTVKTRAWLAEIQERYRKQASNQGPVFEDFTAELVIVYAEDSERGTRFLSTNEKLPVAREKMRDFAIGNLTRLLPKLAMTQEGDGLFTVSGNGDYDSSLMLLDQIWTGDNVKVKGDIVVAIPVRNILLVTGTKERKGLKAIRAISVKLAAEGPASQTDTLFVYRKGKWAKYGRKSRKGDAEQ